jgi:hypothetical protein
MRKASLHWAFLASVLAMGMTVSAQAQTAVTIQPTPQPTEVNLIPFAQGPNPPSATAGGYVLTTNSPTSSIEANTAPNPPGFSIMQVLYGSNYTLLNGTAAGAAATQTFLNTAGVNVEATVKYAGNANTIGYFANGASGPATTAFHAIQTVTGNGFITSPTPVMLSPGATGSPFSFGLSSTNGVVTVFYSQNQNQTGVTGLTDQGPTGFNHVAIFQIGAAGSGEYALAWEDGPGGGDRDYNDLVVQINFLPSVVVPEPSTMALTGLGALGLIGYGLRRRKAKGA